MLSKTDKEKTNIMIEWNDGHTSNYSPTWLKDNCMMKESRLHRTEMKKPRFWDSQTLTQIPTCRFQDIIDDNGGLLRWLEQIHEEGICLITGSGVQEDAVVRKLL